MGRFGLLFASFVISLVPVLGAGCSSSWSYRMTSLSGGSVHYSTDGRDVLVERLDPTGPLHVAVHDHGELSGAAGLNDRDREMFGLSADTPARDHPRLPAWREQAARLAAAATPADFLDAAFGLPFRALVSSHVDAFVDGSPDRAAAILDRADDLLVLRATVARLVPAAAAADGADDARLARWARLDAVVEHGDAALELATAAAAGPRTATALLERIDDVPFGARAGVYVAAGRRIVADPLLAPLLVRHTGDLPGSDRAEAILTLLGDAAATPALGEIVLADIDEFYGSDRPRVYVEAARATLGRPQGEQLIVRRIDELYGNDRGKTAREIVAWTGATPELVAGFARRLDEFHGRDRAAVLDALAASPGFRGRAQEDVVRAAATELYPRDRAAALDRLAAADNLEPAARELLDRYRAGSNR